jgi:hypothetical protein
MDDIDIRTYLGQPEPEKDDIDAKASMFSVMNDQSGWNAHYSHGNYEYTVMKKYTARWYFAVWHRIDESSTESELSSYKYPNKYNGGLETAGEGELMWRGRAKCGGASGRNGAGMVCYGSHSGSPNSSPNGGLGCKERLGYRWSGALEWMSTCLALVCCWLWLVVCLGGI